MQQFLGFSEQLKVGTGMVSEVILASVQLVVRDLNGQPISKDRLRANPQKHKVLRLMFMAQYIEPKHLDPMDVEQHQEQGATATGIIDISASFWKEAQGCSSSIRELDTDTDSEDEDTMMELLMGTDDEHTDSRDDDVQSQVFTWLQQTRAVGKGVPKLSETARAAAEVLTKRRTVAAHDANAAASNACSHPTAATPHQQPPSSNAGPEVDMVEVSSPPRHRNRRQRRMTQPAQQPVGQSGEKRRHTELKQDTTATQNPAVPVAGSSTTAARNPCPPLEGAEAGARGKAEGKVDSPVVAVLSQQMPVFGACMMLTSKQA